MVHAEGLSTAPPEVYSTALQAGDYAVVVQACSPETSRKKGTQGLKWEYIVEDGPDQTFEKTDGTTYTQSPIGRHIFDTEWLPNSSMADGGKFCASRLAKICEVLGVQQSDDLDEQEFVGKRCKLRLKVVTENENGEKLLDPRNEVTRWMASE